MDKKKADRDTPPAPPPLGPTFDVPANGHEAKPVFVQKFPNSTSLIVSAFEGLLRQAFLRSYLENLGGTEEAHIFAVENIGSWDPLTITFEHKSIPELVKISEQIGWVVQEALGEMVATHLPGEPETRNLREIDAGPRPGLGYELRFTHPLQALALLRALASTADFHNLRTHDETLIRGEKLAGSDISDRELTTFRQAYGAALREGGEIYRTMPEAVLTHMPMRPYASLGDAIATTHLTVENSYRKNWHTIRTDLIENAIARDLGKKPPHPVVDLH